jgi:hypothetical protein
MAGESYSNALTHDMNYYNPLRHNDGRIGSKNIYPNTALSNSELNRVAEDIRSENMTTEQRALNHQWLQHGYSDHGIRLGSKVISKLFKMGFRTYWDGVRNKHYKYSTAVPDGSGNGKVTQDVDYKLRLSDNRVKIAINYDF